MGSLNDDILIKIFECLSLNERVNVRLCSKRFKELCDNIKIYKLVINSYLPLYPGYFKYTTQFFDWKDIVNVGNADKFFSNQILINQMKSSIKYLQIFYVSGELILNLKFNELIYLSLNSIELKEYEILHSPKLEHLIFECVTIRLNKQKYSLINENKSIKNDDQSTKNDDELIKKVENYLNINKSYTNFKKFNIENKADLKSLRILNENYNLIKNIEYFSAYLDCFRIFVVIINSRMFPNLKLFNCYLIHDLEKFLDDKELVIKFANKLDNEQNQLELYLFNIQYTKLTASFIVDFIRKLYLTNQIKLINFKPCLIIRSITDKILNKYLNNNKFNEFFKIFKQLIVLDETLFNLNLLNKLTNIESILFVFQNYPKIEFGIKRYLEQFNKLKHISIEFEINDYFNSKVRIYNDLLDQLSKYSNQITSMGIISFERINHDFLFQFKDRLSYLNLQVYYPIPFHYILKIVKDYKYLMVLSIIQVRTDDLTNDNLTNFKLKFNEYLTKIMKINYNTFKIEIFKKDNLQFVRYFYRRYNLRCDDGEAISEKEKTNMFKLIKYKMKNRH